MPVSRRKPMSVMWFARCEFYCQRGRGGNGADDGDMGHQRLLRDLKRRRRPLTSRISGSLPCQGSPALRDPMSNGFVGRIVPPDVLKNAQAVSRMLKQTDGVQSPLSAGTAPAAVAARAAGAGILPGKSAHPPAGRGQV